MPVQVFLRLFRFLLLSFWLGVTTWFGYLQAPVLFRDFPSLAGEIMEVLFPSYWTMGYLMLGVSALLYTATALGKLYKEDFIRAGLLILAIAFVASNHHYFYPKVIAASEETKLAQSMAFFAGEDIAGVRGSQLGEQHQPSDKERELAISRAKRTFAFWHGASRISELAVIIIVVSIIISEMIQRQRLARIY